MTFGRTSSRPTLTGLRLAVLAFIAGTAFAHDPFEITTAAMLRDDALTLDVTMARSTALAVANGVPEGPTFDPEKFVELRAKFAAVAPRLFVVKAGDTLLAPRQAEVVLGREADVEFHLRYPRPMRGPLVLTAPHLAKLAPGHGNVLVVRDTHGATLGDKLLSASDASLEIALATSPAKSSRSIRYGAATAALLLAFALLQWTLRRKKPGPTWVSHAR